LKLLEQSKAIRTFVLPEVQALIETIKPDYNAVVMYETQIVEWLKPVVDLSDFYVYPTNGITEGLNWWMSNETRAIYMDDGDYQWVQESENQYDECIKYISVPSAIDGNFKLVPTTEEIALDLAYVGSTINQKINIDNNVKHAFYSLSKSFGLRNIRTGWYFSREKDHRLELLIHNAKYYNYFAHSVAEAVIQKFDTEYVFNTLSEHQAIAADKYDLEPSDVVWLATTTDPLYDKFKRGSINRVSLIEEIKSTLNC
jgi:hypothetical protein|tara:strand:+ start:7158 stop:7925 length:768 start_codon:yes stop_codon:yes gene_type:complete